MTDVPLTQTQIRTLYINYIIAMVVQDYGGISDEIKAKLLTASFDEVERTYEAFYRFGAKTVIDIITQGEVGK